MLGEKRRNFDRREVDPELTKLELWPSVNRLLLKEDEKERFLRLEKAVKAYLVDFEPVKTIQDHFGIGRHAVRRIVKRCLKSHPDGRIWGYRALLYYCRQKHYERRAKPKVGCGAKRSGHSGKLGLLFDSYPFLQELVHTLFLKKPVRGFIHEPRIPLIHIHARFIKECRKLGIKDTEYPFTVMQMGRVALWNYLKKTFHEELEKAAKARYGKNTARKIRQVPTGMSENVPITRPLEKVEFDAHSFNYKSVKGYDVPHWIAENPDEIFKIHWWERMGGNESNEKLSKLCITSR